MVFTCFPPAAQLKPFIEHIVISKFQFNNPKDIKAVFNVFPSNLCYLCITLADPFQVIEKDKIITRANSVLVGLHQKPTSLLLGNYTATVYIGYKPWALHKFLDVPQTEMINKCEDDTHLLGKDLKNLADQLMYAKNDQEINQLTQNYLIKQHRDDLVEQPIDLALNYWMSTGGSKPITAIASQSCLSLRQFQREFKKRVGLSPKSYSRLSRFTYLMKFRESHPGYTWGEIALRFGYYDYMHFIHEFKYFTDTTPSSIELADVTLPIPAIYK